MASVRVRKTNVHAARRYNDEDTPNMLKSQLPSNYSHVESTSEALEAALPKTDVTLRIHIVWDNPASNLNLERVLDDMRTTGAAMVTKVEAL